MKKNQLVSLYFQTPEENNSNDSTNKTVEKPESTNKTDNTTSNSSSTTAAPSTTSKLTTIKETLKFEVEIRDYQDPSAETRKKSIEK